MATYPLIDALKSPSRDVRAQAARALGERAVPIAVEPLVKRLKDGEPAVKLQAVIALGRIGHAEAIPAVLPLVAEAMFFWRIRRGRRCGGSATGRSPRRDSTRRTPRFVPALCWRWTRCMTGRRQPAGRFRRLDQAARRRAGPGARVSGRDRLARRRPGTANGGAPSRPSSNRRPGRSPGTARPRHDDDPQAGDRSVRPVRTAAVEAMARTNVADDARRFCADCSRASKIPASSRAIAIALGKLADTDSLDLLTAALRDPHSPDRSARRPSRPSR